MANVGNTDSQKDFAHAFGEALNDFLIKEGMGQSEAARLLGIEAIGGESRKGGARIYSYCRDSKHGKRPKPNGEILFLACTKLPGFSFDYNGYRINAETLGSNGTKPSQELAEQLTLGFEHQFNLTKKRGTVEVKVRRPAGRIELSISLDAKLS